MANNPKKMLDPTEAALSAIQEALNLREGDTMPDLGQDGGGEPLASPEETGRRGMQAPPAFAEPGNGASGGRKAETHGLRVANDDQQSIGQILQSLQRRPARASYVVAGVFSAAWVIGCLALSWAYLSDLNAALGPNHSSAAVMIGLGAAALLPIIFFFGVAHMAWRAQELRLIAQSMASVAIRLAEPEGVARDSIVTVGQAIRREVSAMGDGVERALARAGELEVAGAERDRGARTHLQRQRGPYSRIDPGTRQSARHARRPGRAGALLDQQCAHRSHPGPFHDQRSRRPAGQRGGADHHAIAGGEGRAYHPHARPDRRQYDPAIERPRRRHDRAPGDHQRRDDARDRCRQRPAHLEPQLQDR